MARRLNQKQRRVLKQLAEFLEIFRAEGAIDYAVIATHPDAHPLTDHDLVAVIDTAFFPIAPIERIKPCGGLMIAEKLSMP